MDITFWIAHVTGVVAGIVLALMAQSAGRAGEKQAKAEYKGHVPPRPMPARRVLPEPPAAPSGG